ncbi:hypothetical protein AGMMS50267_15110 [Spirochaetia bacterium]|nr:hypothetical protein AGMMS50267_15110 [Spirochaetia bacterium]
MDISTAGTYIKDTQHIPFSAAGSLRTPGTYFGGGANPAAGVSVETDFSSLLGKMAPAGTTAPGTGIDKQVPSDATASDTNSGKAATALSAERFTGSSKKPVIDKTDKLYEQCEQLEMFLLKTLVSGMRKTVQKSELIDTGFAGEMYEDMLYDEYTKDFSKNANFGLAELAYTELTGQRGKLMTNRF